MNTPDNRTVHIFNGRGMQDIQRLADAIAGKLSLQLFNLDGRLCWLDEAGQITPVSRRLLQNLIARHFVTVRLATRDDGTHFAEFLQLEIEGQNLIDVMDSLVKLVAIGRSRPKTLSEHQKQEIKERARVGESRDSIAKYY